MPNYALPGCRLIDCVHSGVQENSTVLVKDGKIEKTGGTDDIEIPKDYTVLDTRDKYVMPGLINAHVHLFGSGKPMKAGAGGKTQDRTVKLLNTWPGRKLIESMVRRHALTALNSGLTTVRAVGDMFYSDVKTRDLIDGGKIPGPRLLVSGPLICVTGGHGHALGYIADSPWEARKLVRRNISRQVDLIKICVTGGVMDARRIGDAGRPQMTIEEITAVCEEAHKAGFMVAAHAQSAAGVRLALLGGVDTIEHGSEFDEETIGLFLNNPKSLKGYSCLIPTIIPAIAIGELDTELTKTKPVNRENSRRVYEGMVKGMRQAMAAGVKVGVGTDVSCPYATHYNTWRELYYAVKFAKVSPETAIRNATRVNAEILGISDIAGTLEAGKSADLIVLKENPLDHLRALSEVCMVMAGALFIPNPKVKTIPEVDRILDSLDEVKTGV
jgi:imidazolonepropionase-like amidohydrolase